MAVATEEGAPLSVSARSAALSEDEAGSCQKETVEEATQAQVRRRQVIAEGWDTRRPGMHGNDILRLLSPI